MQFRIGKRGAGKTQDLLNEFLDDKSASSLFVCFNQAEAKRVKTMLNASAEGSTLFPKHFKGLTKKQILAKVAQVKTIEQLLTESSKGRGFLYIDNLDIALQGLASSRGFEIKAATVTE